MTFFYLVIFGMIIVHLIRESYGKTSERLLDEVMICLVGGLIGGLVSSYLLGGL